MARSGEVGYLGNVKASRNQGGKRLVRFLLWIQAMKPSTRRLMVRAQTVRKLALRPDELARVAGGGGKHNGQSAWACQDCGDTLSATSKYCLG